jgi:hypothetical protein
MQALQRGSGELMGDTTGGMNAALLRHDRMIVANELRSVFSSWKDRLVALAMLAIAVAGVRYFLSEGPFVIAATAVAAVAAAAGAAAARAIGRRLDFHSQDGVLAAYALTKAVQRHYILSIHALVCGVVCMCAVIGRPEAAVLAPIGYLVGASICHVAGRVELAIVSRRQSSLLRAIRSLLQRPISGVLAAIPVLLSLLFLKSIGPGPMAAFIGLLSAAAALALTMVDYGVVRFMTESGYGARRIMAIQLPSLLTFLVLGALASLALSRELVTIVVVGVSLAALVLMAARILAYRVHSKRAADMLVSIYGAVACLAGIAMPMLLPVVVIAILWHLHRRSIPATWLLT